MLESPLLVLKGLKHTSCLGFSRDGTRLAVGGEHIVVWEIPSGKQLFAFPTRMGTSGLAFDERGETLLRSRSFGREIERFDLRTGQPLPAISLDAPRELAARLRCDYGPIATMPLDPRFAMVPAQLNGLVARGSTHSSIALVDLDAAQLLKTFETGITASGEVSFSPNRRYAAGFDWTADFDVWVFDVRAGQKIRSITLPERPDSVAISDDGARVVVTSSSDGWPDPAAADSEDLGTSFTPQTRRTLAPFVSIWDATTEIARIELGGARATEIHPDGARFMLALSEATLLCSLDTGRELRRFPGSRPARLLPDGVRVLQGGVDRATLLDLESGATLRTFATERDYLLPQSSPCGRWVYSLRRGGDVELFSLETAARETATRSANAPSVATKRSRPDRGVNPRWARPEHYRAPLVTLKDDDATSQYEYAGTGVTRDEHPLSKSCDGFMPCSFCERADVLVVYARYAISHASGDAYYDCEVYCADCKRFTTKSFSEH